MESLWNDEEAEKLGNDPLIIRVYTSRLLGREGDLVLHGGGNTSVKVRKKNLFGEEEDILFVKGSGWDLATIETAGFAPVRMKTLLQMAELDQLIDIEMVRYQRSAMTDPSAPSPSVEAVLHAIIPYRFVDHTHADAVVTISNTSEGEKRIRELYGDKMLIVPYVMPGFVLARRIFELTRGLNWEETEGIILLQHGVFTFSDDARESYEGMIRIVTKAERYLDEFAPLELDPVKSGDPDTLKIASLRRAVSHLWGNPVLAEYDPSDIANAFSGYSNLGEVATRGPLTPDHIIRTKRSPLVLSENHEEDLRRYAQEYRDYFDAFSSEGLTSLDSAPRWAVWPGHGAMMFGVGLHDVHVVKDIARHTMRAILRAEKIDSWTALDGRNLFDMEYWTLEQEKLKKGRSRKSMQGRIALVTGAASGIGKACVQRLVAEGAVVVAIDISPSVLTTFSSEAVLPIECDVTAHACVRKAIENAVAHFGGLDMLVANAGVFPGSRKIAEMKPETWDKSLDINLTSHQRLLTLCLPYLELGIDPAVVIVGSKNVAAPGPGVAAYSVAKAGLTQLARVAAMELGPKGIRVNVVHPNAVFDTGIWSEEVLKTRAHHYGMSVEEYKSNNILKTEVRSADVADMAVTMLGPVFSKTTGAQIPVDGGNERTI